MKKRWFRLLFLLVPLFFCAAQAGEGLAGRLSSISSSLAAAHISLAPGTRIRVTNLETGRSIVVIVSRRLSADSGHIVELTVPAAEAIGLMNEARVRVEPLNSDGTPAPAAAPPPPVSAGGGVREPPSTGSPNTREVPATRSSPSTRETPGAGGPNTRGIPDTRNSPLTDGRPGEQ
ncbi:MAG: septal ring lytic transglycosylase RlpA family protein, partial [Treponema sp.]|nr:septal ring lytic transglycosylase RlpA family protein [Treponema sp.]